MNKYTLSLILIIVSLVLYYLQTVLQKTTEDDATEFYLAGRRLNAWELASTLLSTSYAFANGIWYSFFLGLFVGMQALILSVAWTVSYVLVSHFFSHIQPKLSQQTIHGVVSRFIGRKAMLFLVLATLFGFTGNLGWELAVSSDLLQIIFNVTLGVSQQVLLLILLSVIPASYCFLAGFRGNSSTDHPQNVLSAVATIILLYGAGILAQQAGSHKTFWSLFKEILDFRNLDYTPFGGVFGFITLFFVSLVWQFVDMSGWQSIAAAQQDPKTAKYGLWIASIFVLIFPGFLSTAAGALLRGFTTEQDVTKLIAASIDQSILTFALACSGFLAAVLSTVDGFLMASAQVVSWDIAGKISDSEKSIRLGRIVLFIQTIVSSLLIYGLIQWLGKERLGLIVPIIYSAQIILLGPVCYSIYRESHKTSNTGKLKGAQYYLGYLFIAALSLPFLFTWAGFNQLAAVSPLIWAFLSFGVWLLPKEETRE